MSTFDRLMSIADQLGKMEIGNPVADRFIHDALGRAGPVLAYSRNEAAAGLLLPGGFVWCETTYSSGLVYASCQRRGPDGDQSHPHHGQWAKTPELAMCGAALRAYAAMIKPA